MIDYKKLANDARSRLKEIDREREHLMGLVRHLEALAGDVQLPPATMPHRPTYIKSGKRKAPTMAPTRDAARSILEEVGKPIETRDLLPLIRERGVEVGGKDPVATLSARLSNSSEFVVRRGVGWWFSDQSFPGEEFEEAESYTVEGDTSASSESNDEGGESNAAALI